MQPDQQIISPEAHWAQLTSDQSVKKLIRLYPIFEQRHFDNKRLANSGYFTDLSLN